MDMPIRPISSPEPDLQQIIGATAESTSGPAASPAAVQDQPPAQKKVEKTDEIDIETIHAVIALARRVAKQNYEEHLEAARSAKTQEELEAAIAAATLAFDASNSMRVAQRYFDAAEGNVQLGGLQFMQGKEREAATSFTAAGDHIRATAGKIDEFSAYVMQSRFMETALSIVARADDVKDLAVEKVAGAYVSFEQSAVRTAEGFSRGLKSFSERMVEFGHKVAAAPQQIHEYAREKATSFVEATASVLTGFLSRAKKAIQAKTDAIDAKVAEVDRKIDAKMQAIDARVTDGIDRVKEDAHHAWTTLEQHAQAAMKAGRDLGERAKAEGQEIALNARAAAHAVSNIAKIARAAVASEFVASKTKLASEQQSARSAKP